MKALLVYPEFPVTYWGFQHVMPLVGCRASLPPLGLISLAALLPREWELRLVDMNIEPLSDDDLRWADAVLVGGMHIQKPSIHQVLRRARALGRVTVVGGPAPTTTPAEFVDADVIFQGEAEGRIDSLERALTRAERSARLLALPEGSPRPDLRSVPTPRFDLLKLEAYTSMAIQYSRGCPFCCEFCDIVEVFGRVPRHKDAPQILRELDALYRLGFRRSVFFVDDNFIGNRVGVKALLPEVARWQRERGYPFELYTEASVNLAADVDLVRAMTEAGFASVFLGIETPSASALREAKKMQNLRTDLAGAVKSLTAAGLEVMGGFIVGFDQDDESVFEAQRRFISSSPIPLAMVGLLNALPGTALWRRLGREGRLRDTTAGDTFGRPNFQPAMDEEQLLVGYARLLEELYSAEGYYRRCEAYLDIASKARLPGRKRLSLPHLLTFARAIAGIGLRRGPSRRPFWRLLRHALLRAPHAFPWAVGHAIMGEHMIRYTREVLPRLEQALLELRQSRTAPCKAALSPSSAEPGATLTRPTLCA